MVRTVIVVFVLLYYLLLRDGDFVLHMYPPTTICSDRTLIEEISKKVQKDNNFQGTDR